MLHPFEYLFYYSSIAGSFAGWIPILFLSRLWARLFAFIHTQDAWLVDESKDGIECNAVSVISSSSTPSLAFQESKC
jgi:hypothetical protein